MPDPSPLPKKKLRTRLFGELHWSPPSWAAAGARGASAAGARLRAHKRGVAMVAASVLVLLFGGRYWMLHRPQPEKVATIGVVLHGPEHTYIEEHPQPRGLQIDFGGSVARLDQLSKPLKAGVTLTPALRGEWKWQNDHTLVFTPAAEWAIQQDYKVTIDRSVVSPHVTLERSVLEFKTAPFTVTLSSLEFYEDPKNPRIKRVEGTLEFSHPVDPASLVHAVSLNFGAPTKDFLGRTQPAPAYPFSISYDKLKGHAYVHSEPVSIPEKDKVMALTVAPGVKAAMGGPATEEASSREVNVPGMFTFFHVSQSSVSLVRNPRFEPEQVLFVQLTTAVAEKELQKNLSVWVLPKDKPAEPGRKEQRNFTWSSPDLVGSDVLKASKALKWTAIPAEHEEATLHTFKFEAEVGRYLFVRIKKGTRSAGGYILGEDAEQILRVPPYPEELSILHEGALLSLAGEKKVSVLARGLNALRFEVGRVLPNQLNHFVTQAGGNFAHPNLYGLNEDTLSEHFSEVRALTPVAAGKAQYAGFDLTPYMTPKESSASKRGLFLFHVEGWDVENKRATGARDDRLLLVTDLGLLVKDAADDTHDVFVQTLSSGLPAAAVKVSVLGKNGLPLVTATTDAEGHVAFPKLTDYHREQEPTVYVAVHGEDLAFIPFQRGDRELNFTRFDVGGVSDDRSHSALNAFLFSDRGIYRPGDTFHVAAVVKSADWAANVGGVPLEAVVLDPRGLEIHRMKLTTRKAGLEEISYTTDETSPTGNYQVNLYIVKDKQRWSLLGSTSVRVEEFLPDRMRISTHFSTEREEGWVSPVGLKGRVSLKNLFGIPAAQRRVTAEIVLTPGYPRFRSYKDYVFSDPLTTKHVFTERLGETKTDDAGEVELELGLEKFEKATWRLSLLAEGYEAGGGRGVSAEATVLVSPLPYLLGYKADGDLSFVNKGSARSVQVLAVNPKLEKLAVAGLRAQLIEQRWVSVLTQQPNGTYRYQSVRKDLMLQSHPVSLPATGLALPLVTDQAGDFAILLMDADNVELARIAYSVTGSANLTRSLEKNAELEIKLDKPDYAAGDEIEVSIRAAYTGAGLLTIERDHVYAFKWFKADATSTVQKIRVPAGLEGNAYVNVAFVRAMGSEEIFMSPLSYGVKPFSISRENRVFKAEITTPEIAKPGEPLAIHYKGNHKGKAVVYAVDEGILQVAGYATPDPLGYFLKKRALQVRTAQILDLLLPEFSLSQRLSATGGDSDGKGALGKNLNPFKRKRDKAVAYWSGVVDIGPEDRVLTYDVPQSFSGSLRVMVVAVSSEALGAASRGVIVRGPFVLSPNAPSFVTPGDEFTVGLAVANNVEGAKAGTAVRVALQPSAQLELLDGAERTLQVATGHEGSTTFRLRARSALGSATLAFTASLGGQTSAQAVDLSVRPAVPYLTTLTTGILTDAKVDVPVPRQLYPDYRTLKVSVSPLPLSLAQGLLSYLERYPYGCTEQIVSRSFPAVLLKGRKDFGVSASMADDSFATTLRTLQARQNEDGAFGLWAANSHAPVFPSLYALHYLIEAKERGFPVPADVLERGMAFLRTQSELSPSSLEQARDIAYAQYLMTRQSVVTTAWVNTLRERLERDFKGWRTDLTAGFVAASYRMLRQDKEAEDALKKLQFGKWSSVRLGLFEDPLTVDSQLLYLLARHFPERLAAVDTAALGKLVEPITLQQFNSLSSSLAILGLERYGTALVQRDFAVRDSVHVQQVAGGATTALALPEGLFPQLNFSDKASQLQISNSSKTPVFYQATQAGFDAVLPTTAITEKLEIHREYLGLDGKALGEVPLGAEVEVHLRLRGVNASYGQVAVTDLLPGGFEVVLDRAPGNDEAQSQPENSEEAEAGRANANANEGEGEGEGEGDAAADASDAADAQADDAAAAGAPSSRTDVATSYTPPVGSEKSTWHPEYADVREDRVVLFGTVGPELAEFVYRIKATNTGKYVVPPAFAEGMYDRTVRARSLPDRVTVKAP